MMARLAVRPRGQTSVGAQMRGRIRPHGTISIRRITDCTEPGCIVQALANATVKVESCVHAIKSGKLKHESDIACSMALKFLARRDEEWEGVERGLPVVNGCAEGSVADVEDEGAGDSSSDRREKGRSG
ncbi:hypothetical protein BDFG_06881 [Blastomyces dermatitidis ATCC 26199]|nr:hypothetical protein BDFG_06881 [Blastomyces dermatitidis ATCC 26199]